MANKHLFCFALCLSLLFCGCASIPKPAAVPAAAPSSLKAGETNIVALAVPAPTGAPHATLPEFLGLGKLFGAIGGGVNRVFSRLKSALGLTGKFPGLQPKPPVVPITDPANLSEEASPAVKAAAKVKAEEDQAEQKVQALRYLATIGCSDCYPEVEDALLAALDDCTEAVRFTAIKALRGQSNQPCSCCQSGGCCSEKVQKKLNKLVNDVNKLGRRVEPSERIRRQARIILQACGPPIGSSKPGSPTEGPSSVLEKDKSSKPTLAPTKPAAVLKPNASGLAANELGESEIPVGFVDNQAISTKELNSTIRTQLVKLGKTKIEELSPSIRAAVTQDSMQIAIDTKLKQAAFLATKPEIDKWDASQQQELDDWFAGLISAATPVTDKQVLEYYQQNSEKFKEPASVKWEKAFVTIDSPSKFKSAVKVLQYMRSVAMGKPMAKPKEHARLQIQVESAPWTRLEEVGNATLRSALLSTAVGQPSAVFRVDDQLVLIRVLNRKQESVKPLNAAKEAIRESLILANKESGQGKWLVNARARASIWTVFDAKPPTKIVQQRSDPKPLAEGSESIQGMSFLPMRGSINDQGPETNSEPTVGRVSYDQGFDDSKVRLIESVLPNDDALGTERHDSTSPILFSPLPELEPGLSSWEFPDHR
ncbi:MAG: hypothetical protein ACI87E_004264 [Mariniblastus sp.]